VGVRRKPKTSPLPIAATLQKVIDDIAHKDLGKARDRLHILVSQNPHDLELRHILGRIYLELRYPQRAGKYLYLVDSQDDDVAYAIREYEKSCQSNPSYILSGLKFRIKANKLKPGYAMEKLRELEMKCRLQVKHISTPIPTAKRGLSNLDICKFWAIGCLLVLLFILIIGVVQIISWIYAWVAGLFG
jgi:hypothetical protein